MNRIPTKYLLMAGLFLLAFLWVGLMGLVGAFGSSSYERVGGAPFEDDGTVQAEITRVDNDNFHITLTVKITDKNGEPLPLDKEGIEVYENGQLVQLSNYIPGGQAPVRVCLVMDYSASMRQELKGAKEAALALVNDLRNEIDHLGLYFFSGDLDAAGKMEVLSMGPLNSRRRQQAVKAIQDTPLSLKTPMFASMEEAMIKMESIPGRRIMVVLTDGMDTNRRKGPSMRDNALAISKKHKIPMHMISIPAGKGKKGGRLDEKGMKMLARESGGSYVHAPSSSDLKDLYSDLSQSLKDEYVLEYDSPNPVENGVRRTVIVTARSGAKGAKAKDGYNVPGVIATGTGQTFSEDSPEADSGTPLAFVFLPLSLLLGLLFGVPYFMWLKAKS